MTESRVTLHMAASLDGFIARRDGRVDWLETSDEFPGGETLDPEFAEAFLKAIDCYVMGSRTYETALNFEATGAGWVYGDKPVFVLTSRALPRARDTVEFYSGDLAQLVNARLRPMFRKIWIVGGGTVAGDCLRLALADEIVYSVLPIVIGDGIRFFEKLRKDVLLHLVEVKAYRSGMVELRYDVRGGDARIRQALPSEQRLLEALQMRASLANPGDREALLAHPDAIELPLEHIQAGHVFVLETGGAIKGFASVLGRNDGDAELDALFVEPDTWRRGFGRALVEHCVTTARRRGGAAIHVVGNPHAEPFYRACGFEVVGTAETRFGPALAMRRTL